VSGSWVDEREDEEDGVDNISQEIRIQNSG
jgi:hypothetical protein